jgi:hypothetical protein
MFDTINSWFGPSSSLGREFMLLLVDCRIAQLSHVLIRLDGLKVDFRGKELAISFAVGWRAYQRGDQVIDLIDGADQHLYANKHSLKSQRNPSRQLSKYSWSSDR